MKTFKDMWEDAKKKKDLYDGRTKLGRKFVERIMARRKAAEAKREIKNENV